jgi:ABC-type phosphate transport system substrate-binding protein
MRLKKSKQWENDDLVVKALANYICAEAGRSGILSQGIDISNVSAGLESSEKTQRAAYKQARKTLALFM